MNKALHNIDTTNWDSGGQFSSCSCDLCDLQGKSHVNDSSTDYVPNPPPLELLKQCNNANWVESKMEFMIARKAHPTSSREVGCCSVPLRLTQCVWAGGRICTEYRAPKGLLRLKTIAVQS
jgi:hypothetical protein